MIMSSMLLLFSVLLSNAFTPNLPCGSWSPPKHLSRIKVQEDCRQTQGDLAVAKPKSIYWCSKVAKQLEEYDPGISVFYYVHEYGHYVEGSDEKKVDCWAAKQLANTCYISIAKSHFLRWGDQYLENYGYMRDRANNIEKCSKQ
jgi:hypothetical protein